MVVLVEIACTLSKCATKCRSASCCMVAADTGVLSFAGRGGDVTSAGSTSAACSSLQDTQGCNTPSTAGCCELVPLAGSCLLIVSQQQYPAQACVPFLKLFQGCSGHLQLLPPVPSNAVSCRKQCSIRNVHSEPTCRKHSMPQLHPRQQPQPQQPNASCS